jgi:hypothetical protein
MDETGGGRDTKYQLWGWILFVVCAGFFIVSSIQNQDTFGLAASIIFLIACIVFLIPLVFKQKRNTKA